MKTIISAAALSFIVLTPAFAEEAKAPATAIPAPVAKSVEAPKPVTGAQGAVVTSQPTVKSGETTKTDTMKTGDAKLAPATGASSGGGASAVKPADAPKSPTAGAGSGQPAAASTSPTTTPAAKPVEAPKADLKK